MASKRKVLVLKTGEKPDTGLVNEVYLHEQIDLLREHLENLKTRLLGNTSWDELP